MNEKLGNLNALRLERGAKSYNSHTMTFEDLYDILGNTNDRVIIDNDLYTKGFHDKLSGHSYKFIVTSAGIINICQLYDENKKWRLFAYDITNRRFIIE